MNLLKPPVFNLPDKPYYGLKNQTRSESYENYPNVEKLCKTLPEDLKKFIIGTILELSDLVKLDPVFIYLLFELSAGTGNWPNLKLILGEFDVPKKNLAICLAAQNNNLTVAKMLTENGFSDELNQSALCEAARFGHIEMCRFLLENGWDINGFDQNNCTSIDLALYHQHYVVAKFLIESSAEINVNCIALTWCVRDHQTDIILTILDRCKDKNYFLNVCLALAIHFADIQLVEFLLDAGTEQYNPQLTESVYIENSAIVKILLDFGADVGYNHQQALFLALQRNNYEIVDLLIQAGANINYIVTRETREADLGFAFCFRHDNFIDLRSYSTPLIVCCSMGHKKLVELLIENGVDIHHDADSALCGAIFNNHYDITELLIKHGANVNTIKNPQPIIYAIIEGNYDIFKLLVENGAVLPTDKTNKELLGDIICGENYQIAKKLFEEIEFSSSDVQQNLSDAIRRGAVEIINLLLDHGATFDSPDLLHPAIINNNSKIAKYLLSKFSYSADEINAEFEFATRYNRVDVAKLLAEYGAVWNKPAVLARARERGHQNLVDFLIKFEISEEKIGV